jgi:hypothetical protein
MSNTTVSLQRSAYVQYDCKFQELEESCLQHKTASKELANKLIAEEKAKVLVETQLGNLQSYST